MAFLVKCFNFTLRLLLHLLQFFLITQYVMGVFYLWKSAIITPVHKKGDIYDIANYRSVSFLFALSKVLEKIVNR